MDTHEDGPRRGVGECGRSLEATSVNTERCPECGQILDCKDGAIPWHVPRIPLSQRTINLVRKRALASLLLSGARENVRPKKVRHLWFPGDDTQKYALRDGNPPHDKDRPKHLRGFDLVVDPTQAPDYVWDDMIYYFHVDKQRASVDPMSILDVLKNPDIAARFLRAGERLLPKA